MVVGSLATFIKLRNFHTKVTWSPCHCQSGITARVGGRTFEPCSSLSLESLRVITKIYIQIIYSKLNERRLGLVGQHVQRSGGNQFKMPVDFNSSDCDLFIS